MVYNWVLSNLAFLTVLYGTDKAKSQRVVGMKERRKDRCAIIKVGLN